MASPSSSVVAAAAGEVLAVGPPRAAGIPSGFSVRCGGFTSLDRSIVKQYIDLSFERLLLILHTYPQIKRVIYSANKDDLLKIGSGIFKPTPAVIDYISRGINGLSKTVPRSLLSFEEIRDKELQLAHVPLALNYAKFLQQQLVSRKPEVRKAEAGQSSLLTLGVSRAQAKPGAMLGSGKAAPSGKAPLVNLGTLPKAMGGIIQPARSGVGSKRSIGNSNVHTFVKK